MIEKAKETVCVSAHSSKYNKNQIKFNYCLKLYTYFGNVIIGFMMQIFWTFGKTQVRSKCPPHYWLGMTELITWDPLGHLKGAANLGEIISRTSTLLRMFCRETAQVPHLHTINIPLEFRLKVFNSSPWDTSVLQVCIPPWWLLVTVPQFQNP